MTDAPKFGTWYPIATAPKDRVIDLWAAERTRHENSRITDCWWHDGRWVHLATIFDQETNDDMAPVYRATYWMPPPEPPK